jgi:NADPH:quinone reductase-like Zn-dependent oxidoreductase
MQYLTAYGALIEHAYITKGDFVVVTAASNSVGIAAAIEIEDRRGNQHRNHANTREKDGAG